MSVSRHKQIQESSRTGSSLWQGLSLVELLVVMLISLIVTGVAFTIYRLNTSYYLREEAYLQQQQNMRTALYTLSRDLRMAGNGLFVLGPKVSTVQAYVGSMEIITSDHGVVDGDMEGWFHHADTTTPGIRAIFGVDGGALYSDTLTLFRAEGEIGVPLERVAAFTGNTLTLTSPLKVDGIIQPDDIIALVNGSDATILQVDSVNSTDTQIDIVLGGRFTGPAGPPSGFPVVGSYIYNLRDVNIVTYYVDETNYCLMAAHYAPDRGGDPDDYTKFVTVADNIEDLQIFYFFGNDEVLFGKEKNTPTIDSNLLKTTNVKAVSIGITSRSSYGNGPLRYRRPALFNRDAGAVTDNFRRNSLAQTIYLRNY